MNQVPNKKVRFYGENCGVYIGRYANGQTLLTLSCEDCLPMATASVSIPEYSHGCGRVFIKNWSENQGILEALVEAGIVEDTGEKVPTGFAEAHVCRLLV